MIAENSHFFIIISVSWSSVVASVEPLNSNGYAVADFNYSTEHNRCDGEAHEQTSLRVKQDHIQT